MRILVLVLVLHRGAVTSSAGPRGLFKGMTTATSGVIARFPLLLPVRDSVASYGASAVTRTSDRGHVAEASNQGSRSGGVGARGEKQKNNSPPDKLMSMSVEVVKGAKSLHWVH